MGKYQMKAEHEADMLSEMVYARMWADAHPEFGADRARMLIPPRFRSDTGESLEDRTPDLERDRMVRFYASEEWLQMETLAQNASEEYNQREGRVGQSAETDFFAQREEEAGLDGDADFYHAWTYLDPRHGKVLELRFVAGASFAEIGRELGLGENAVRGGGAPRARYPRALVEARRVFAAHYFHSTTGECPDGPWSVHIAEFVRGPDGLDETEPDWEDDWQFKHDWPEG